MTVQLAKVLKDYLEEIDEKKLREFQWYLGQHKQKGCHLIQTSQLENASRTETVDKLVQTYGEDGAVVETLDVLHRMKLNDLATKLLQG